MSDATVEHLSELLRRYEAAIAIRDEAMRAVHDAHTHADAADEELVSAEVALAAWLDEAKAVVRLTVRQRHAEQSYGAEKGQL